MRTELIDDPVIQTGTSLGFALLWTCMGCKMPTAMLPSHSLFQVLVKMELLEYRVNYPLSSLEVKSISNRKI